MLANGLSLESEWQLVSLGLQDSSQYSGWFEQCCSLDVLDLPSNFQLFQPAYQAFGDRSEHAIYNWYHCLPHFS